MVLAGCVGMVKGEYFLSSQEYKKGISVFEKEIEKEPSSAENHFYLGRFYLAENKFKKANAHLKKAVSYKPDSEKYRFWLGLSHAGLKQYRSEQRSYLKAIELNQNYYPAHTYLGHCYFREKQYKKALKSYDTALLIRKNNPAAVYNRALILYTLKRYPEAVQGFKKYIDAYPYSPKIVRAAGYLNRTGDFEYRIHLINRRKMVVKKIQFQPAKTELTRESIDVLRQIGQRLKNNPDLVLYVLSYQKNNKPLAREKAGAVKQYLLDYYSTLKPEHIQLSWFDAGEKIDTGKKRYTLDESISFFAALKTVLK